jgi:hypothetical protein
MASIAFVSAAEAGTADRNPGIAAKPPLPFPYRDSADTSSLRPFLRYGLRRLRLFRLFLAFNDGLAATLPAVPAARDAMLARFLTTIEVSHA